MLGRCYGIFARRWDGGNILLTRITAICRHGQPAKAAILPDHARPLCRCALVIGYFGVNAYTGNHGLRAKQDLDQQYAALSEELGRLKEERAEWQRRVKLLKSDSIDPDTLDERARAVLGYLEPRELTLMLKRP